MANVQDKAGAGRAEAAAAPVRAEPLAQILCTGPWVLYKDKLNYFGETFIKYRFVCKCV